MSFCKFEVFVAVAVRVDEQFEIVVMENHRVVLGQGTPDMRLFEFGRDVEILVVPLHFGAGPESGARLGAAFNVDKVRCPRRIPPPAIDPAVDANGFFGARADVSVRRGWQRNLKEQEK